MNSYPCPTAGTAGPSVSVQLGRSLASVCFRPFGSTLILLAGVLLASAFDSTARAQSLTYDANDLGVITSSGEPVTNVSQSTATGGKMRAFNADGIGDFVTFRVNVPADDTYVIEIDYVFSNNRGIYQLAIDGIDQGDPVDLYGSGYNHFNLGEHSLTAGNHQFTFTVVGQNPEASSFRMGLDLITLTPSGGTLEVFPTGLSATATSTNEIDLTWLDNSSDESGFVIERQTGNTGGFSAVATVAANVTAFTDTGLATATAYTYRVAAVLPAGNSDYSNEAETTTQNESTAATLVFDANALNDNDSSGDPVTNVNQAAGNNGNIRAFNADALGDFVNFRVNVPTEDIYQIEVRYVFSNNRGIYQLAIDGVDQGDPVDLYGSDYVTINLGTRALTADKHDFTFTVVGQNPASSSFRMGLDVILLTPVFVPTPAAPGDLTATAVSSSAIDLAWTDESTDETAFLLERRTGTGGLFVPLADLAADTIAYTDTGLAPGTSYTYRLAATNAGGSSAFSNEASATTEAGSGSGDTNFDANELPLLGNSGEDVVTVEKADASNGNFLRFDSDQVGDFISFAITVPTTSVYRLEAVFHTNAYRGIAQLSIDGNVHGSDHDPYSESPGFATFDLGDKLLAAGPHEFTFTIVGQNFASEDYQFGLDRLVLTALDTTIPDAPVALSATSVSSNHVTLTWAASTGEPTHFTVERQAPGGTFAPIASPTASTYEDIGLVGDTTYLYRVSATNAAGDSVFSATASATTPAATIPTAPTALTAVATSTTTIDLTWTDQADNEATYLIERRLTAASPFSVVATVGFNATSYTDSGLEASTGYTYRVSAANEAGVSPATNEASATTEAEPIVVIAPADLSATAVSNTRIDLTWNDASDNETAFIVERASGGSFAEVATLPAGTTSYADEGLTLNTSYSYRVVALSDIYLSPYSNETSARTLAAGAVRAFPTAVGYGAYARGGRGGIVKFVTSLDDDGPGTLRDALRGDSPRTIIFRVGGTIHLQSRLQILGSNVTVAGQTAPGDGILIADNLMRVANATDVVVRHIAVRSGNVGTGLDNRDAFEIEHANNVIVDHSSFSWSVDEVFTGWFPDTHDFTVQNSIISEPLWNAGHSKGSHPMGLLIGRGVRNVTIYENYLAHVGFRTPEFTTGAVLDVVNNVVHNWGQRGVTWSAGEKENFGPAFANVMNNIFHAGEGHDGNGSGRDGPAIIFIEKDSDWAGTQIHISGNEDGNGNPADGIQGDFNGGDFSPVLSAFPIGANGVPQGPWDLTVRPVAGLAERVLTNVGRTRPQSDVVDTRVISDYWTNTSRRPNSIADVGGYPVMANGTPYPDADADGMDDTWELGNGLDPTDPADRNADRDGDGYTNLEEFLNGLAGDYELDYNPAVAPVLTSQPATTTIIAGQSVTFSVTSSGNPTPTYQWRRDGIALADATAATFTLASTTATDAGSYDVVVSNLAGTVISDVALLTVHTPPVINAQPTDATVTAFTPVTFIVDANGDPAPTYQWQRNGVDVGGATTASYTLISPMVADSGNFTVVISNTAGTVTSAPAHLVVNPAPASITLDGLAAIYDGSPHVATAQTTPTGLPVLLTYDGATAAPTEADAYAVAAHVNDANYLGSAIGTLVISPAPALVTLSDLRHAYDGTAKTPTATTSPADLPVLLTFNGDTTAPWLPGNYAVAADVLDPNHSGTAQETLVVSAAALVRHAPSINGGLDGSAQMLTGENVTLNGSTWVSGDLLVPGTPAQRLNGHPTFAGTIEANGATTPANYTVTLNGNAVLRYLVQRVDPIPLPVVSPPAAPTGTRSVSLNQNQVDPGDFATLRDLTLNSQVGAIAVPPGAYGNFTANHGSAFVLGTPGATEPAVYHLQRLTVNSHASINIVGPTIINLAQSISLNGNAGAADHPDWLRLQIHAGGLTINGNATLHGHVIAPDGTVTINGDLRGEVISDRLTINGNGLLQQSP